MAVAHRREDRDPQIAEALVVEHVETTEAASEAIGVTSEAAGAASEAIGAASEAIGAASGATEAASSGGLTAGGTTGNEQLTTMTGLLLLAPLAVIGVTLLQLRTLLWVHLFVGMLLFGPLALKLASTGYRFVRYYTRDAAYRRKGAPPLPLRLLAPFLLVSTVVVMITGVLLLLLGPSSRGALLPVHKLSFIAWGVFAGLHVVGHLPEISRALGLDAARTVASLGPAAAAAIGGGAHAGRIGRALSLASAVVGGAVLAVLLIPRFTPWLHLPHLHH